MAKKKDADQASESSSSLSLGHALGPSFEERLARLQAIVNALESGNSPLGESVALYREGLSHSAACRQQLTDARHELEVFSDGQCEPLPSALTPSLSPDNDDEGAWS